MDASIVVTGAPAEPFVLLGTPGGMRLEARGVEAGLALRGTGPDVEVWVQDQDRRLRQRAGPGRAARRRRLDGARAGRSSPLEVGFDLELSWSSSGGFQLGGSSAGFELALPLDKTIGPLTLDELTLALARTGDDTSLDAGISFSLVLGPFILVIERIGLRAALVDAGDPTALARFGDTGVHLGLLPPSGVRDRRRRRRDRHRRRVPPAGAGDPRPVLRGRPARDARPRPHRGRHRGDAELPGDPDGWSLFLSVIADFTEIPISSVTLNGVGGFMGLNRTLDGRALTEGVQEGRLDSLLFPTDPLAEATRILADIEAYSPTTGSTRSAPW